MKDGNQFTAVIRQEGKLFVALCPELDVVSQGKSAKEARQNLKEAVELFLKEASPHEVHQRLQRA